MASLPIVTYPDSILRQNAAPIEKVDRAVRKLVDNMVETMYEAPGIGLAANQVGKALQVVVIDLQREEDEHGLISLINPTIVTAQGEICFEEGCLSVPDYFARVRRHNEVTIRALDLDGHPFYLSASGFLAVVLQHELDHLSGHLFIDRINPLARDIFKRRWKKKLKQASA